MTWTAATALKSHSAETSAPPSVAIRWLNSLRNTFSMDVQSKQILPPLGVGTRRLEASWWAAVMLSTVVLLAVLGQAVSRQGGHACQAQLLSMMAWLLLVVPVGALTTRRELQAYAFDWVVQAGDSGYDEGRAIAPDGLGRYCVTGCRGTRQAELRTGGKRGKLLPACSQPLATSGGVSPVDPMPGGIVSIEVVRGLIVKEGLTGCPYSQRLGEMLDYVLTLMEALMASSPAALTALAAEMAAKMADPLPHGATNVADISAPPALLLAKPVEPGASESAFAPLICVSKASAALTEFMTKHGGERSPRFEMLAGACARAHSCTTTAAKEEARGGPRPPMHIDLTPWTFRVQALTCRCSSPAAASRISRHRRRPRCSQRRWYAEASLTKRTAAPFPRPCTSRPGWAHS